MDISTIIGVLSTIAAVISMIFAWKAINVAKRSNSVGIYTELHKIYQSPETFRAIKTVWSLYNQHEGSEAGKLINKQQAHELISSLDRDSTEWKAIHEMSLFWKYVSILMRRKYLDEEIAFELFTSPRMLGFLAPVERAFLEYHYGGVDKGNRLPLLWLYNRWKKYIEDKNS